MDAALVGVVFWGSAAAVAYPYAGYPLLLTLLARRRPRPAVSEEALPSVSFIVAAYNEEACIAGKIANVLEHDYPSDRLELLVVSDASSDRTDTIVSGLAGPRLKLLVQPARSGKNLALNRGTGEARGEIVVFSDANAMMAPGALKRLVAPFADTRVGLVSGQGIYGEDGEATTRAVSNGYARYESFLKECEGALGFVAAADGALYAMRRGLYRELAANQVHDLVHPIQVALAGRRSVFEPEAFTVEPASSGSAQEFRRHVRIIAQGFLAFLSHVPALVGAGCWKALGMLVSHRLLRWTSCGFLLGALLANLALLGTHAVYTLTLVAQAAFYGLALLGAAGERLHVRLRLLALPYFFCVVSAAGLSGFVQFLRGQGHAVWRPTGGSAKG